MIEGSGAAMQGGVGDFCEKEEEISGRSQSFFRWKQTKQNKQIKIK
jgi:hypothetical protein